VLNSTSVQVSVQMMLHPRPAVNLPLLTTIMTMVDFWCCNAPFFLGQGMVFATTQFVNALSMSSTGRYTDKPITAYMFRSMNLCDGTRLKLPPGSLSDGLSSHHTQQLTFYM